jgi:uncharacterized protein YjbI with pentapeptide repeats
MTTVTAPGWDTCAESDCGGVRLAVGDRCIAHASEQDTVVELRRIGDRGALDLRGVAVNSELLEHLLAAVPRGDDDRPVLTEARFDEASFKGETKFDGVILQSPATFSGATFQGDVLFLRVTFTGEANFAKAKFEEDVSFREATFHGDAVFDTAIFGGSARFTRTTFKAKAAFDHATFKHVPRSIEGLPTSSMVSFMAAKFQGDALFSESRFESSADFLLAEYSANAQFGKAIFEQQAEFSKARFYSGAFFNSAVFQDRALFEQATFDGTAHFVHTRFNKEGEFREAQFRNGACFSEAVFEQSATFKQATFHRDALFGINVNGVQARPSVVELVLEPGREPATFKAIGDFSDSSFHGRVEFGETTFQREADFSTARFEAEAGFGKVIFRGPARFHGAIFKAHRTDTAASSNANDGNTPNFREATFQDAYFDEAIFEGSADFLEATFHGWAGFNKATFEQLAGFGGVQFRKQVGFDGTVFEDAAWFGGTSFEQRVRLGPMRVGGELTLGKAVASQRFVLETEAQLLSCSQAEFAGGVLLQISGSDISLDNADLKAPSILVGTTQLKGGRTEPTDPKTRMPRLISLRGADVGGLTISNVDLGPCRFAGAHNLDKLRIEQCSFPLAPHGWRWTSRQTLAEEHHWRELQYVTSPNAEWFVRLGDHSHGPPTEHGWYPSTCRDSSLPWCEEVTQPAQIAGIYRSLRKGREDNRDEPGAADFYYGEMEMRRHAASWWSVEWMLLTLYWLVSGYALRAWRAFATLLLVLIIAAGLFSTVGFKPPDSPRLVPVRVTSTGMLVYEQQPVTRPSAWRQAPAAFGYSAEVATSLLRGPQHPVTAIGEWTQAVLRWLGPLLFGLALLSLRGRVKR